MHNKAQAAAAGTAFQNLREKTSPETKRMAGALLAAFAAPSLLGLIDNQDQGMINELGSGAVSAAGSLAGGYLGYKQSHLANEEIKDAFVREAVKDLKTKSQIIAAEQGAAAGIEYFSNAKRQLLQDIGQLDPKRANAFNNSVRKNVPEIGDMIADLDLLRKSPREIQGMTRGAALGAVAAALPAYLALRGGDMGETLE